MTPDEDKNKLGGVRIDPARLKTQITKLKLGALNGQDYEDEIWRDGHNYALDTVLALLPVEDTEQ